MRRLQPLSAAGSRFPARRTCVMSWSAHFRSREANQDAIPARLDRSVPESRMSRARSLAARRIHTAGNMQQLRLASASRAAAARTAIPDAATAARRLPARASTVAPLRGLRACLPTGGLYLRHSGFVFRVASAPEALFLASARRASVSSHGQQLDPVGLVPLTALSAWA